MSLRPEIDKRSCASSGRCIEAASEAFGIDSDHLAEVLTGAAELDDERLRTIARACPSLAISLLDEQGNEVDF